MDRPTVTPTRRQLLIGASLGLLAPVVGCSTRPGMDTVNKAIAEAPGVIETNIYRGPGGGLGNDLGGQIRFDVPAESLRDAFDEAWRRGVRVLHEVVEGERHHLADFVFGYAGEESLSARQLLGPDHSGVANLGHFYDRYGIG